MSTDDFINMNNIPNDNMKNIIKNFNPFEILQPTKPEVAKGNLLVDLSDDQPKNDVTDDINGSLLDRTTKSEFDVVDLFQNMYINPEHLETKDGENPSVFSEKKDNDWIKDFESIDCVNDIKVDIKEDLISIFTEPINTNPNASVDDDEEDKLIDEVLAMKRVKPFGIWDLGSPRRILSENQIVSDMTVNLRNVYMMNDTESGKFKDVGISNINKPLTLKDPTQMRTLPDDFHQHVCYKNYTEKGVPGFDKELIKISNPICMIQAVKLDKKKYQKRQILSDEVKIGYTRGPDLIEKSIALPPMIERIKAREKNLKERESIRRRLVVWPDIFNTGHEGTSKNFMANKETPASLNPT